MEMSHDDIIATLSDDELVDDVLEAQLSSNNNDDNTSSFRKRLLQAQILDEEVVNDSYERNHDIEDFEQLLYEESNNPIGNNAHMLNTSILNEMDAAIEGIKKWQNRNDGMKDQDMDDVIPSSAYDDDYVASASAIDTYTEISNQETLDKIEALESKVKSLENLIQECHELRTPKDKHAPLTENDLLEMDKRRCQLERFRTDTIEDSAHADNFDVQRQMMEQMMIEELEFENNALLLNSQMLNYHDDLDDILARDDILRQNKTR